MSRPTYTPEVANAALRFWSKHWEEMRMVFDRGEISTLDGDGNPFWKGLFGVMLDAAGAGVDGVDFETHKRWVAGRCNLANAALGGTKQLTLRPGPTNPTSLVDPLVLTHAAIGLAGEAGEVLELVKKIVMHGRTVKAELLLEELGDLMWYFALLCYETGLTLENILKFNKAKLEEQDGRHGEKFTEARTAKDAEKVNLSALSLERLKDLGWISENEPHTITKIGVQVLGGLALGVCGEL